MAYGNGSTTPGYVTLPPADNVRTPHVTAQMNTLTNRTEELNGAISELQARLQAVLQPEGPTQPGKAPEVAPHPAVPLGASLAQMNDRLGICIVRLNEIMGRIEV